MHVCQKESPALSSQSQDRWREIVCIQHTVLKWCEPVSLVSVKTGKFVIPNVYYMVLFPVIILLVTPDFQAKFI